MELEFSECTCSSSVDNSFGLIVRNAKDYGYRLCPTYNALMVEVTYLLSVMEV